MYTCIQWTPDHKSTKTSLKKIQLYKGWGWNFVIYFLDSCTELCESGNFKQKRFFFEGLLNSWLIASLQSAK